MDNLPVVQAAFLDELEKIAAAKGRLSVPKGRTGKRPMSVGTLLKKDKEGTLFKTMHEAFDHYLGGNK